MTRREFYELLTVCWSEHSLDLNLLWQEYLDHLKVKRDANALHVLICVGEPSCAWHRVIPAALRLAEDPRFSIYLTMCPSATDIAWADIVWLQRIIVPGGLQLAGRARDTGKRVIYELDDDFEHIPPENPSYDRIRNGPQQLVRQLIGAADVAAFSTATLAKVYAPFAAKTVVWPNCVDPDMWPWLDGPDHEGIVLGFSGSPTHNEDLAMIEPVLQRVMAEHSNVWFCHFGMYPGVRVLALPPERCMYLAMDPGPVYMTRYTQMFDIGLAPLVDNAFNRAKSPLRLIEYGAGHIPIVASNVGEYASSGIPCWYAESEDDWYRSIVGFVECEPTRRWMGHSAAAIVAGHHDYDSNIHRWADTLLSLA